MKCLQYKQQFKCECKTVRISPTRGALVAKDALKKITREAFPPAPSCSETVIYIKVPVQYFILNKLIRSVLLRHVLQYVRCYFEMRILHLAAA